VQGTSVQNKRSGIQNVGDNRAGYKSAVSDNAYASSLGRNSGGAEVLGRKFQGSSKVTELEFMD